jgi:hypothetical protein
VDFLPQKPKFDGFNFSTSFQRLAWPSFGRYQTNNNNNNNNNNNSNGATSLGGTCPQR